MFINTVDISRDLFLKYIFYHANFEMLELKLKIII